MVFGVGGVGGFGCIGRPGHERIGFDPNPGEFVAEVGVDPQQFGGDRLVSFGVGEVRALPCDDGDDPGGSVLIVGVRGNEIGL